MPVDYDNPCAVLALLKPAYYALIAGSKEQEVEFQSQGGVKRRVRYTTASIPLLKTEIAELETKCAARGGSRPRRFAITGG